MLRKKYVLASLAILLLSTSALIAQRTSTNASPAVQDFVVIDSTGKNVGHVIGVDAFGATAVAFPFHGKPLPIGVGRSSFTQEGLSYTTSDCTGQAYQDASNTPFLTTTVLGTNNTLYVENGPIQTVTLMSTLYPPPQGCSPFTFTDSNMVPMTPVLDLNKVFTPPFSVVFK